MALEEANKDAKQVKPFSSKSFYLDLIGFNEIKSLSDDIVLLGGTLEPFLSKDVSCVITNRTQRRRGLGKCNVNPIASPRRECLTPDKKTPNKLNNNKDSAKSQVVLRGLEILKKAAKINAGNCNVLDNAEKWGIEIINLTEVQAIVEKYKTKLAWKRQMLKKAAESKASGVKELLKPFIKFEAVNRQSRPVYTEFSSWPTTVFSSEKCLIFSSAKSKKKSLEATTATVNALKSKKKFCEICCLPYQEINSHLESDRHRKAVNETGKFAVFDSLIKERYNLDWYLAEQYSENSSLYESFDVEMVSPLHDQSVDENGLSCRENISFERSPLLMPDNHKISTKSNVPLTNNSNQRKRSYELIKPISSSIGNANLNSHFNSSDEETVNEIVNDICFSVSLFDPGIQTIML